MEYYNVEKKIAKEISYTLDSVDENEVDTLIKMIKDSDKVFFVGVGRVLLSLEAIAKRLAHIGINTFVVGQITEPAITEHDLLIVGSGSGESSFPLAMATKAHSLGATVAHIGANPNSSMNKVSNHFVRIPVQTKLNLPNEIQSIQPMTSLFEQSLLLLGDTIALMVIEDEDINMKNLWQYHANLE